MEGYIPVCYLRSISESLEYEQRMVHLTRNLCHYRAALRWYCGLAELF